MSKKNRKSRKLKNEEIKSAVAGPELTESVPMEPSTESTPMDPARPEEVVGSSSEREPSSPEGRSTSAPVEETSADDLLDDVRRSLIEEETEKNQKDSRWWWPLGKKENEPEPETLPTSLEIDLPDSLVPADVIEEPEEKAVPGDYAEQIDDLIDMLEIENPEPVESVVPPLEAEALPEPEPEPEIDFDKLKEEAFRPRTPDEQSQTDSDVRSVALADGEEVFVEVESKPADPLAERMSALENALKPYRRYFYLGLTFLGVVMAVIASLIIFNVYQQSRPEPVRDVSNLPYPTHVSLPGGWSFQLGRGSLQDGQWKPKGPEWLEGTEVCRWISLPWSRQLEAVLRTLNAKDPIELVMSNNDKLIYRVYSVYEMTPQEIQELDSNSPCLLVILTDSGSEKRWVLTALP